MKKNKRIFFIVVILIIIGIIFGIIKLVGNKEDKIQKLAKIYEELNNNQTYLFEMEQNSNNKTIMAKKGNKTIIKITNSTKRKIKTGIRKNLNKYNNKLINYQKIPVVSQIISIVIFLLIIKRLTRL